MSSEMQTLIKLSRASSMLMEQVADRLNVKQADLADRSISETSDTTEEVIGDVFDLETLTKWAGELTNNSLETSLEDLNLQAMAAGEDTVDKEHFLKNDEVILALMIRTIPLFVYHGYLAGRLDEGSVEENKITPEDFVRVFKTIAGDEESGTAKFDRIIENLSNMITNETAVFIKETALSTLCSTEEERMLFLSGMSLGHSLTKEMRHVCNSEE